MTLIEPQSNINVMKISDSIQQALKQCAHILIGTLQLFLRLCFSRRDRQLLYVIWCSCRRNRHRKSPYPFRHKIFVIEKFALTLMLFRRSVSSTEYVERALKRFERKLTKDVLSGIQAQVRELLVLAWLIFLYYILFHPIHPSWAAWLIVVYIIIGTINYPLCIVFIDICKPKWEPQSFTRLIFLLALSKKKDG